MSLRAAFFGSPAFSVPALRALVGAGHTVAAVYCQPPRPAHRGHAITRCAIHEAADALGLPVRTPAKLRHDAAAHAAFAALTLDVAVVAAYGLILPQIMLDAPRRGCLNIHASLLPRWRGAAPIQRAILAGDTQTGVTIMRMEAGLDTGPMLLSEALPIDAQTTTPLLHDSLAQIGADLILQALDAWPSPVAQPNDGVTYAAKLTRDDGRLDFTREAAVLDRQIRALVPWPGCHADFAGETLKILLATPVLVGGKPGTILDDHFTVACGSGGLRLEKVQRPGRAAVSGQAFLRGVADWRGLALG